MKSSLRLLTSAVIVAGGAASAYLVSEPAIKRWKAATPKPSATPAATDSQPPADLLAPIMASNITVDEAGDQQLLKAIARLEQRESVTARIRQEAHAGPAPFYGAGSYRQQGRGIRRHVRWLLESQRDGVHATLLQVSDGESLWTDRRLATGRQIEWVNLWQVRRQARTAALAPTGSTNDEPASAPFSPHFASSHGGLPSLLESLRDHFVFSEPRAFRFGQQQVIGLVGRWRPEALSLIVGDLSDLDDNQLTPAALREKLGEYLAGHSLPAHMPHHVLLLLGHSDQFPYLIDYRGASDPLSQPGVAQADLYQLSRAPLSRLELDDVVFNEPINSGEFIYSPPEEPERIDLTAVFIQRTKKRSVLRQLRQQVDQMARNSDGQLR